MCFLPRCPVTLVAPPINNTYVAVIAERTVSGQPGIILCLKLAQYEQVDIVFEYLLGIQLGLSSMNPTLVKECDQIYRLFV
jgi:hypothetical protein